MSTIIGKFGSLIRHPQDVLGFIHKCSLASYELIRANRLGALFGLFSAGVTGQNVYINYLSFKNNGLIEREIYDNKMLLNPSDEGISHDLITFQGRELMSTSAYRQQLRVLRKQIDGKITVFEIGANIGYYLLQTADILGTRSSIHAFEPAASNLELLRQNIARNEFEEFVNVIHAAVGDREMDVELMIANKSNHHTVNSGERDVHDEGEYIDSVKIPMYTINSYSDSRGIVPDKVNVIRMDVEGHELKIFNGMSSLLEAAAPLLIFVELHPHRIGVKDVNKIIQYLDSEDFELVSATQSVHKEPFEKELEAESIEDLYGIERGFRLIVKRN